MMEACKPRSRLLNQTTGAIVKVVRQTQTRDDFATLGVVGNSVGLVEREHSTGGSKVLRTFATLDPLRHNRITGEWTPPVGTDHLVSQVSRNQGVANVAVYAIDLSSRFQPTVFTSNVADDTFGPVVSITDEDFVNGGDPPMAYDSVANRLSSAMPSWAILLCREKLRLSTWRRALSQSSTG